METDHSLGCRNRRRYNSKLKNAAKRISLCRIFLVHKTIFKLFFLAAGKLCLFGKPVYAAEQLKAFALAQFFLSPLCLRLKISIP